MERSERDAKGERGNEKGRRTEREREREGETDRDTNTSPTRESPTTSPSHGLWPTYLLAEHPYPDLNL
tara:strand:- start:4 stop:207 length:204 start_codon:yes stop_codon:yes gene_type:complete